MAYKGGGYSAILAPLAEKIVYVVWQHLLFVKIRYIAVGSFCSLHEYHVMPA